jgi:hypothetical protein
MAKSKYKPDTVEKILEAIARDGCDGSGWLAGGISEAIFYTWQRQDSEFLQSVVRAKEEFRKYCPYLSGISKASLIAPLKIHLWTTRIPQL